MIKMCSRRLLFLLIDQYISVKQVDSTSTFVLIIQIFWTTKIIRTYHIKVKLFYAILISTTKSIILLLATLLLFEI